MKHEDILIDKLESVKDRYDELTAAISDPETVKDYPRYDSYVREMASIADLVGKYRQYHELERHLAEAEELLDDPAFSDEARAEIAILEEDKKNLIHEIEGLLTPPDPMEGRNVILEIRAGVGGEEAALFAMDLLRMYQKYAEKCGLSASLISLDKTDLGGVSDALMIVSGRKAWAMFRYESGVHCVKRVPVTESGGRIHTSTATVATMPEAEDIEVDIRPEDIRIDVFHASGHGGQGVNTTDSAVRITYLPTGLSVSCQDERSQLENKAKAMKVLRSRLLDQMMQDQRDGMDSARRSQIGSGERSEKIRTYFFNHDFVVDHRINMTLHRVSAVLDGDIAPFVEALDKAGRAQH